MHIGISEQFTGLEGRDGAWMIEAGQMLEEIGFHSVWSPERMIFFPKLESAHPYGSDAHDEAQTNRGLFEAFTALAAIAATTRRIRVGTYVSLPSLRHPVITAREVATIDQISGGRFDFGVGVSWVREEHEVFGVPWENRGARVTEYLRAMKSMWTEELVEFHGDFVSLPPSYIGPKPVQTPHPPILVGGNTRAALRRIVAVGDGWLGYNLPRPELEAFVEELHAALREAGRSPDEVSLKIGRRTKGGVGTPRSRAVDRSSWAEDAAYITECAEVGIDEVVISTRMPTDGYEELMRSYADAVGVGG